MALTLGSILHIDVVVFDRNKKKTHGSVEVQTWDKPQKTKRALKFWGYCWLGMVVTAFVPIAHFVLVPGLFLAGPIGAWFLSQQDSVVLGGKGTCPTCAAELIIVRGPDQWPLTDLCAKCQMPVTIEKIVQP